MIKILLSAFMLVLFFQGCSQKTEHMIQLEDKAERNINIRILNYKKPQVPKDKFFYHKSWHYKQNVYSKRDYFRNDEVLGTFYLAHHATRIYIRGDRRTVKAYSKYFKRHQVEAMIIPIPLSKYRRGKIRIDYFSLNPNIILTHDLLGKNAGVSSVKNILKANSEVVEIPKDFIKSKRI